MRAHRNPSLLPTPELALTDSEWNQVRVALQLTERQEDVVRAILHGMKDKRIAETLRMSPYTVRTHLTTLFARLGVEDRVGLLLRIFAVLRATSHKSAS